FGEKYGDRVRVVQMGDFSTELCGGTHVGRTGEIGFFKIVGESSVAAGVRRIEGVTGPGALAWVRGLETTLDAIAREVAAPADQVTTRIQKLREQTKALERQIQQLKQAKASAASGDVLGQARDVGGVKVLTTRVELGDGRSMRELADVLRDKLGSGVVALGSQADGKVLLLVAVTKDLTKRFHAGKLIGPMAEIVGGRGGGKPDFAQAGGSDPSKLDASLERLYALIEQAAGA
ncbi:MAG: alanine--tRNA ligase, partial [Myxococcales bacterium]|nr:alanine--tRNA ligase [Myxococcales bacterium]